MKIGTTIIEKDLRRVVRGLELTNNISSYLEDLKIHRSFRIVIVIKWLKFLGHSAVSQHIRISGKDRPPY